MKAMTDKIDIIKELSKIECLNKVKILDLENYVNKKMQNPNDYGVGTELKKAIISFCNDNDIIDYKILTNNIISNDGFIYFILGGMIIKIGYCDEKNVTVNFGIFGGDNKELYTIYEYIIECINVFIINETNSIYHRLNEYKEKISTLEKGKAEYLDLKEKIKMLKKGEN